MAKEGKNSQKRNNGAKAAKGITVSKADDFSEWYTQVIQKADLADIRFGIQGFLVHKPWGFFITRKIYEYLENAVELQGHKAFLFPRAVKEKFLTLEADHAGFTPEVMWVSEAGDSKLEERFALPPTGEAQIYPMYALWFRSHRDLPFKGYQSRISAFRNEMTTRPFLRGREFMFFETHNVYNKHEEALDQIQKDLKTCDDVIRGKVKIPFYYFKRPAWDKFLGANDTFTPDTLMPDGKRNQLGSTHDLGQNFAKAFGIKIKNKEEEEQFAYQTCFGPGVWRIMAALIGIHGDDKGMVIPFDMAPTQVIIVPITFKKKPELSAKVIEQCKKLETELQEAGFRCEFDNSDISSGEKYNKWEMRGVPLRIEIGPRDIENNSVMTAMRVGGEKEPVPVADVVKAVTQKAQLIDDAIGARAEEYFTENVRDASTMDDVVAVIDEHRGFIRVPFCSVEMDGETCEKIVKDRTTGARVCGTLYPEPDAVKKGAVCVACGKEAKHVVYLAKSY